jgi:hypothetical protein
MFIALQVKTAILNLIRSFIGSQWRLLRRLVVFDRNLVVVYKQRGLKSFEHIVSGLRYCLVRQRAGNYSSQP